MFEYPRICAPRPLSSSLGVRVAGLEIVTPDRDLDLCRLEAMRSWVVWVEYEVNRDKRYAVHGALVEHVVAVLVVSVLQTVDVGRYKSPTGHHALVNAFLVQLQSLLWPVWVFDPLWRAFLGMSS